MYNSERINLSLYFEEQNARVIHMLKSSSQLPTLAECRQEGVPLKEEFWCIITKLASAFNAVVDSSKDRADKEISFDCFSSSRPSSVKFEDFCPDSEGVNRWHTIRLVSKINERKLFFSLIKKFLLNGLNINEVLTLEYLIELRWSKMSGEEQAFSALLSTITMLSVNRARNFTSTGKSLLKIVKLLIKDPSKILEIRVSKTVLLFINLLVDLDPYEKSIKLTYDSRVTPPKKFPGKRHIGVSNSQDGSKSGQKDKLDSELLPDTVLPTNESNPASEIFEAWLAIKHELITL